MMNTEAIIFDMDGVIVDNFKYHIEAWKVFGKRHQRIITDDDIFRVFGHTNEEILPMFFDNINQQDIKTLGEEKEVIYREIFAKEIAPAKGLPDFLEKLTKTGLKTAIATGAPEENVHFVLEKTKLKHFFNIIVHAGDVCRGKPDPEIYLKTANKLQTPCENCVVFEDALHGINAAQAAGMKVIALPTTYPKEKLTRADAIINSFDGIDIDSLSRLFQQNKTN